MESAMSVAGASTMSSLLLSKSITSNSTPLVAQFHPRFSSTLPSQLAHLQLSWSLGSARSGPASLVLRPNRFRFSARYKASGGGGGFGGFGGGSGGGGGGGGGSPESGDVKPGVVAAASADASALSSEVIILNVGGMTCGGCAASVKRILESQPQVSSASVDLSTETAFVWPVTEVKATPNWQHDVGEALAKHLTTCGFKSELRDQGATEGDIQL